MKNTKFSLLLFSFLFLSATVFAQNNESGDDEKIPFNGLIVDIAGNPIKRAMIYVESKKRYSISDKNGKFGLTNVKENDTIHIKYRKNYYHIPVEGRKSMKIRLGDQLELADAQEDQVLIDFGYGYVKRREVTTPTGYITGDDLIKSGQTNIINALKGRVAGLQVHDGQVTIRGTSSVNLDCTPLYVVDGSVVTSLDYLSVYDVESVQVLKDGGMYGSRGANGAIVVKTKRGGK